VKRFYFDRSLLHVVHYAIGTLSEFADIRPCSINESQERNIFIKLNLEKSGLFINSQIMIWRKPDGSCKCAVCRLGSSNERVRELDSVRLDSVRFEQGFHVREFESNRKSLFEIPSRTESHVRSKISSPSRPGRHVRSMFDSKCSKCSKR